MNRLSDLSICDLYRAHYIPRWALCNTTYTQSIAEHCWAVSVIVDQVMVELMDSVSADTETLMILGMASLHAGRYALYHDVDEILTSDLPKPVKNIIENSTNSSFSSMISKLATPADGSTQALKGLGSVTCMVKNGNRNKYTFNCHDLVMAVVKICDDVEAVRFITENGVGAVSARVGSDIKSRVNKNMSEATKKFPVFSWGVVFTSLINLMDDSDNSLVEDLLPNASK